MTGRGPSTRGGAEKEAMTITGKGHGTPTVTLSPVFRMARLPPRAAPVGGAVLSVGRNPGRVPGVRGRETGSGKKASCLPSRFAECFQH